MKNLQLFNKADVIFFNKLKNHSGKIFILIFIIFCFYAVQKTAEETRKNKLSACESLPMELSSLYKEYKKYSNLLEQVEMLEKRAKTLYDTGQITTSAYQKAKDNRYKIGQHWLKISDCIDLKKQ